MNKYIFSFEVVVEGTDESAARKALEEASLDFAANAECEEYPTNK